MKPVPARPGRTLAALAFLVVAVLALARRSQSEGIHPSNATAGTQAASASPHVIVGLSPFLDPDTRNTAFRRLVQLLAEDLPARSQLTLVDAHHLQTLAHVEIPEHRAFQSPRTRLNQFSGAIQATRQFLAASRPPTEPGADGPLHLPRFLDFVASDLRRSGASSTRILILGSPLHHDLREPSFSMTDGHFPSDGHLVASAERSPFSLQNRAGRLAGTTVHLVHAGAPWANELHRQKVTRFWTLFLRGQGARLSSLSSDLPSAFRNLLSPVPTSLPVLPEPDPADTRVAMLRLTREAPSSDWISRDAVDRPAAGPPVRTRGPLRIGIRWGLPVDLDLYARAHPNAPRLYFEQPDAPGARYLRDHREASDREFEFVEFTEPVDLREVRAEVNLHDGEAPPTGVDGEVRIEFEDRIHTGRFHIAAARGNRGREGAEQAPYWTTLDIPTLMGLRLPRPGP